MRLGALLVACVLILGCSGGGPPPAPTPGPTPTRAAVSDSDRAYVRDICRAFNKYVTTLGAATQRDPRLYSDQKAFLKVAAPVLDTFARDLAKAKPPKDLANFHGALVERIKTTATKAKAGVLLTPDELGGISKNAPLPPVTVRDRLTEAAETLPECENSGGTDALFGDTGE